MAKRYTKAKNTAVNKFAVQYVPGVCNIDAGGRQKRMLFGIVLLAITLGLWYYLKFVLSAGLALKTVLFIPALLSFSGLWQARLHFCMGNARRHQYEIGGTVAVSDAASIRRDAERAGQVFFYAAVSAVVLAIILVLI